VSAAADAVKRRRRSRARRAQARAKMRAAKESVAAPASLPPSRDPELGIAPTWWYVAGAAALAGAVWLAA
jgi:hypothetical protein